MEKIEGTEKYTVALFVEEKLEINKIVEPDKFNKGILRHLQFCRRNLSRNRLTSDLI